MDLDALKKCKDNSDFDQLMMEDILRGYTDHVHYPNHEQIAIVDHLGNYDLNQIRSFFDAVHQNLDVQFWVGDAISLNILGAPSFSNESISEGIVLKTAPHPRF